MAVLSRNEVLSGSGISGAGSRRKKGWMGHGAGVCCNIMRLLRGKELLLAVRPEAVAGDSSGVDFSPWWSGSMTYKCTGRYTVRGDGGLSVGGSVTLGDSGGMFTLGDAGGIVTRRGGGGIVLTAGRGGMMVGSVGLAMALSNILARSTIDCCWASPNWETGASGAGLVRASVRARATMMAASTEDVFGTGHWCGKNCTVLAVHSALVLGT